MGALIPLLVVQLHLLCSTTSPTLAGCREAEVLEDMPPLLHAEVKAMANQDSVQLIKELAIFSGVEDVILNKLIVSLRSQFLTPGEIVCTEGELGRHLFICRKGMCQVPV
jgi:hypothetical protein